MRKTTQSGFSGHPPPWRSTKRGSFLETVACSLAGSTPARLFYFDP